MGTFGGIRLFIATVLVASSASASNYHSKETIQGAISKNVDGDTVWVEAEEWRRERLKIRMIAIDAPETHLPSPHGVVSQGEWGTKASAQMQRLLPLDTAVEVEDQGKDKYGRTLGRVYRNGKDANLDMVKTGWAIPYIICEGPRCNKSFFDKEDVADYLEACDEARSHGKGIFNPSQPLKEMPFEFRLRMQNRKPDKYVGDFETKKLYRPADYKKVDLCSRIFFMTQKDATRAGYEL